MPLTAEQEQIVHHPLDKHALVLAVAGSGKSHTMSERIAYLVEAKRVDPAHIIAVMFNKSASIEMADKMAKRLGKRNAPDSVTYHRLGTLTLKWLANAKLAPAWEFEASQSRARNFAANVIRPICAKAGHEYPNLVADAFLGFVDRVKSDLATPAQVWAKGDWDARYDWFVEWFGHYERARASKGIRFFSDLIYDPLMILDKSAEARAVVADRYAHIIVDEYQDICESQQALIRYVAGKKARVMVVGDDDQTIYSWRGAKPSYILRDFAKDFPGAVNYRLTRTWRYGHALSCAANYVITNNTDRADKLCISGDQAPDTKIHLVAGETGTSVLRVIEKQIAAGRKLQDIAILVRAYSRSAATQFELLGKTIPFRLEGGDDNSVLNNPWIITLLAWMGLAAGRIAMRPYVGEPDVTTVFQTRKLFLRPHMHLQFDAMKLLCSLIVQDPEEGGGFNTFIANHMRPDEGIIQSRLQAVASLWRKVHPLRKRPVNSIQAHVLAQELCKALNIVDAIKKSCAKEEEAAEIIELVEAFCNYAKTHGCGGLQAFLSHMDDLQSFSDKAKETTDAIHMTSVHRSKGLEWDCVIMIGLEQGRFPLKSRKQRMEDGAWEAHVEDERRLFYVGMTRARKALYLFCPLDGELRKRLGGGRGMAPENLPFNEGAASQFLFESNIFLSERMPFVVAGAVKPSTLAAATPGVFNEYIAILGHEDRVRTTSSSR